MVAALAQSQLVPQALHGVKACGHPLVPGRVDAWSGLSTARWRVDGSRSPGLPSLLGQGGFVMGGLAGPARARLHLQFKRRDGIGARGEAAATLSVVWSPMAAGVHGGHAHRAVSMTHGNFQMQLKGMQGR